MKLSTTVIGSLCALGLAVGCGGGSTPRKRDAAASQGGSGGSSSQGGSGGRTSQGGSGGSSSQGGSGGSSSQGGSGGRDAGAMGGSGGSSSMGGSAGRDAGMGGMGGTAGRDAGMSMGMVMLTISPTTKDFMNAGLNLESAPQDFVITNTGNASAMVNVALGGAGMGHFLISTNGCMGVAVPAQGTCMVTVRFKPTSVGAKMATLTATSGNATAMATLMGTGVQPSMLGVMPMMHDFGTVEINKLGMPQMFVISNSGMGPTGTLTAAVAGSSAWKINNNGCMGMSLNMGQMCTITVNMEPTSLGMKMGTLTVTAANGGMVVARLMGNAVDMIAGPRLAFDAMTKSAGDSPVGAPKPVMFTLSNPGTMPTGVPSLMLMGANAGDFAITGNTCTAMLQPMGTCMVTVTFTPTATGARTATLVASAMPGGSAMATINGNGTPSAMLVVTPSPKDFGLLLEAPNVFTDVDFTVRNTGTVMTGPLTAVVTAGASDFSVQTTQGDCINQQLAMNATCTIKVRFRPVTTGEKTGTLTVSSPPGTSVTVALSGRMANEANDLIDGLQFRYFEPAGIPTALPDFTVTPIKTGTVAGFDVVTPRNRSENYGLEFSGFVRLPETGVYSFYTTSDDGSRLYIDGQLVVDNNGSGMRPRTGGNATITTAGYHAIKVEYYNGLGNSNLVVEWAGPGVTTGPIPGTALKRVKPSALPPVADPGSTVAQQLYYRTYEGVGWQTLPDFTTLVPVKAGTVGTVDAIATRSRVENVAVEFIGFLIVPAAGEYTFATNSDDGSRLWLGTTLVVDNDGLHGPREIQSTVSLSAGTYAFRAAWFNAGGTSDNPPPITVSWAPAGQPLAPIAATSFARSTTQPRVNAGATMAGLSYRVFDNFTQTTVNAIDTSTPTGGAMNIGNFNLATAAGARTMNFALDFRGYVEAPITGDYVFTLDSDDGAILWIDGIPAITWDGPHAANANLMPALPPMQATVRLEAGKHMIRLGYYQGGGQQYLSVGWQPPGQGAASAIPDANLSRN